MGLLLFDNGGMTTRSRSTELLKPIEVAWSPIFARMYDTAFILAERRGLEEVRRDLVSRAKGLVLEMGAGTGLNLRHYPGTISRVQLTEPDPRMAAKLRKRAGSSPLDTSVVEAPAENLPFVVASVEECQRTAAIVEI
jgi:ubiquinone/menaquinone biosynthesis C-methylase UbiE